MQEIWKDIKGYEGFYQVSNMGRVKSLDREIIYKDGRVYKYNGQIIKTYKNNNNGYLTVTLRKNSNIKTFDVHRLVALHFVEGYKDGLVVNHIDEDKTNNKYTNLEWCTYSYNNSYGNHNINHSKKILCITTGKIFNSIKECCNEYDLDNSTVVKVCKGKRKQTKGYEFAYI